MVESVTVDRKRGIWCALDSQDANRALELVAQLQEFCVGFKVGLELFTAHGPDIIKKIRDKTRGSCGIFLDLKLHDIPNTVAQSARVLASLGVDYLTIHASGGREMVRAAVEAVNEAAALANYPAPRVVAVTVLTSHDAESLAAVGQGSDIEQQVLRLARVALENGAAGFVCSGFEIARLRGEFGAKPFLVVPGLRPDRKDNLQDQKRVITPVEALHLGADLLVIGRPITAAADPKAAARAIYDSLALMAPNRSLSEESEKMLESKITRAIEKKLEIPQVNSHSLPNSDERLEVPSLNKEPIRTRETMTVEPESKTKAAEKLSA